MWKGEKPLFTIKYYKIKVFPFSDVMEEIVEKKITFFFLKSTMEKKKY